MSEIDAQNVLLCLQQTLSPNDALRKQAEEQLKQFDKVAGYSVILLKIVSTAQVDLTLRLSAAIALKKLTRNNWSDKSAAVSNFDEEDEALGLDKFIKVQAPEFIINDNDKAMIKTNIVEAIIYAPLKVRIQLGLSLRNIVDFEYPDNWNELVPKIMSYLTSKDYNLMLGALESLRLVVKKYEYTPPGKGRRKPLQTLIQNTFPVLIQLFNALQTMDSIESAQMQLLLTKIFWSAVNFGIPPYLGEDANLIPWMTCMLQLLQRPVNPQGQPADLEERKEYPWWKCKKWTAMIFNRMLQRWGDPKGTDGADQKVFAKKFTTQYAPKILEAMFNILNTLRTSWLPDKVISSAINFLITGIRRPSIYKLMKPHIESLFREILFPLLCFNDTEYRLWKDDPVEYLRREFDFELEYYSPRSAAMNLVVDISNLRAKNHLNPIMTFLAQVLQRYVADKNAFVKDGALIAIGVMCKKLSKLPDFRQQLEPMLLAHVLPEFQSENGFLRARACWVYQQYWDFDFTNKEAFLTALRGNLNCMKDKQLPVRVSAALALKFLMQNDFATEELRPIVPQLVEEFFKLMNEIDNDELVNALELLISQYEEEMIPYAAQITARLAAAFIRMIDADEEDSSIAAFEVLTTIQTILDSITHIPQLYPQMEQILLPVLVKLLENNGNAEFLEDSMRIISFITYYSPTISQNMLALIPAIYQAWKTNGNDYVGDMVTPFDNYVSKAPDAFVNANCMNYLLDIYKTVVGDAETIEEHAGDASKLAEVVLFNYKGKVDNMVEPILEIAVQRLQVAKNSFLKVLLLEVVSDALFYNPLLALQILEKRGWIQGIFTGWFQLIPKFHRTHDKKVVILGLSSIFTVAPNALPQIVKAGISQILTTIINLCASLEKQRKLIEEENEKIKKEEEEADEEEDDDFDVQELDENEDEEINDQEFEKLVKQAAQYHDDDRDDSDDDEDFDDDEIEEENYSSVIDDIDEFVFFVDIFKAFATSDANVYNTLIGQMDNTMKTLFQEVCTAAEKKRAELLAKQAEKNQPKA